MQSSKSNATPAPVATHVLIIGGGPAGIACALELHASHVDCLLLEAGPHLGGQLFDVWHGFPNLATGSYPSGPDLAAVMEQVTKARMCPVRTGHKVEVVDLDQKCVQAGGQSLRARALVIATGYRPRRLPVDDGRFPERVRYLFASGELRRSMQEQGTGRQLVVAGGGDSAACLALDLDGDYAGLHIVNRSQQLRCRHDLRQRLVELVETHPVKIWTGAQISTIGGDNQLQWVEIEDLASGSRTRLAADYLAVKLGYVPNTELVSGQLAMNESGHIECGPYGETSVPGVFACGDITASGYDRVGVAIGQGMLAARGVREFLGRI